MPRMEDILNLPVQDPSFSEFSAANLNWMKVDGGRHGGDDIAMIRFSRVDDFVRGESSNAECPANFRIESRRKRPEGSVSKPRVDGYLEYTLYWCSYGPDDFRDSESGSGDCPNNKPSSGRGSRPGRRHMMRGCLCHFTVKRLYTRPLLALIIYNQRNHVDKAGAPCHGLLDRNAVGTRAMYAPRISEELRQKIMSMLYVGIPLDNIIQHHMEVVERHGGPSNRDDLLTRNDVRNMERVIHHSTYELDVDDECSVKMWVQRHQKCVFFFQDNSETKPFLLGIQTEWQLQQMLHYGHTSFIASHSTFGLNKLQYPLHTLLVFDSCQNVIPIAWVITACSDSHEIYNWMTALFERVRAKDHTWRPNAFLVDDPSLDFSYIRDTFQCRVLLCPWHVRRGLFRGILKKCFNSDVQREMFKELGLILYCSRSEDVVEEFMQIYIDQSDFMEYFKRRWLREISMWVAAMRSFPASNQELHAAVESYHLKLKAKLLDDVHACSRHRVDWLVHMLTTELHSIYWFYKYTEEYGSFRSHVEESFPINSWHRALQIPDIDVMDEEGLHFTKVVSQSDKNLAHTIWNPGSEFSLCDCDWSRAGNLCKHVIKVSIVFRNRLSSAAQIYHQTLTSLLQNPPDDPIVLDHAILHATCMQHELKGLEELSNSGLLQPLPTFETKRQRTLSPDLNVGGLQFDFPMQAFLPVNSLMSKGQIREVPHLSADPPGSNLLTPINNEAVIDSCGVVHDIRE